MIFDKKPYISVAKKKSEGEEEKIRKKWGKKN